jgi:DNA mismatch repair protein MutS
MTKSALDTPMMRQFLAIKAEHPDAIVFYRMGDFYEMFLHDAEIAAPLLDITLTTRDKAKADPVPMCGVPVHAADQHLKRLAELGHRVAICEQVENPSEVAGKRLVKREVVEVVTPGLAGDPERIESGRELSLVALWPGETFGLAVLEASTGELRATQVAAPDGRMPGQLLEELRRIDPRELLLPDSAQELAEALAPEFGDAARTLVDASRFGPGPLPSEIEGLAPDAADPASCAAAALLRYLGTNQPAALVHTTKLRRYALGEAMLLDAATCTHLELFRNSEDGTRARTVFERLDATVTPLGGRRLARWLAYPLLDPAVIHERQDAVAHLADRDRPRARLREALRPVRDLERLLAKAARPSATPRDLVALRRSLDALPGVVLALQAGDEERLDAGAETLPRALPCPEPQSSAAALLAEALVDEPPALARGSRGANETGFIRRGFHAELDGLREGVSKGREWIAGLEADERARTGIATLKIRFHPVHGYSIEVSKSQLSHVPEDYERKQTLANAERFTTEALREVEERVLGGTERAAALEREIFEKVRLSVLEYTDAIRSAAEAIAVVDATAALAEVARRDDWTRPEVDADERLEIQAGRHPVIEPLLHAQGGDEFVPNDAALDTAEQQLMILTGPNMSGKSTYLRQVALIVLLAQIGSFVPAEAARIGVVDRVFTRVGASDRLARGESTFMVEMRETAEILSQATRRSLLILDEIGRGTSTFDGLSIAWAVAEHLHDAPNLGCRTLFATHYHELTELSERKDRVRNGHFEAKEWGDEVLFLRRLVEGGANRSYGIQVARLAGLPSEVITRSREILAGLEATSDRGSVAPRIAAAKSETKSQLGLFESAPSGAEQEVLARLRQSDPNALTPLDALSLLAALRAQLEGGS